MGLLEKLNQKEEINGLRKEGLYCFDFGYFGLSRCEFFKIFSFHSFQFLRSYQNIPFLFFLRACCLICFLIFCFSDIDGGKTNLKVITVYHMGFCVFTETLLLHDQDIHYYKIKDK